MPWDGWRNNQSGQRKRNCRRDRGSRLCSLLTMTTAALLLAAGESTRMGTPKPLLDWGGEPLIAYQVRQLQAAGADVVIVVLGHAAEQIRPVVPEGGVQVVVNERYREGRASSVRAGAAALSNDIEAVIILNVDQPRSAEISRRLLATHRTADFLITMPEYQGHGGHPVVISGTLIAELRRVEEATQGLRAVIERHAAETQRVAIDNPVITLDLNTPEDYVQAHLGFFGRRPTGFPSHVSS